MSETPETVSETPIKRWLAFDVGCIECGESSSIIGTYDTPLEARNAVEAAETEQARNWHGQHYIDVWDLRTGQPVE